MSKIVDIKSREILDSRGYPTLETTVFLDSGIQAKACVPSGASTGVHEACELRDGDKERFNGKGVLKAVGNVEEKIKPLVLEMEVSKQKEIDQKIIKADGTENKKKLGANSILSVSQAVARAAAEDLNIPLYKYLEEKFHSVITVPGSAPQNDIGSVGSCFACPFSSSCEKISQTGSFPTPMFNVINGGLHGSGKLDFQEFLLIPDSSKSFKDALRMGVELYYLLKNYLKKKGLNYSVGDEGGFTPELSSNKKALEFLKKVISQSPYKFGKDIHLGLDLAASEFYDKGFYHFKTFVVPSEAKRSRGISYTPTLDGMRSRRDDIRRREEFIEYLVALQEEYGIFSLEDPLFEDDWQGWSILTKKIGSKVLIIGDDLLVTNLKRLKKAVAEKACNSILVKLNQIGTLSETLEVVRFAQESGFKVVISHRSGETNDDFIADLAAGVGADFVKFGAPARGERVAKYNRLLEIYREKASSY